tara:strand:+ start:1040 stop:1489 length:450 start_codon:yes stop_codon:yes gene_type:complete
MSNNLDLNQMKMPNLKTGESVDSTQTNQLNDEITSMLDQVFDLIFNSSKQVLGNINSIGIRYGQQLDNPDHMLVVFPNEVHGFESWNSQNKSRWRYHRSTKTIMKNGAAVNTKESKSFVQFIQSGLEAMNDQNVVFSKNITQSELKEVS